MSEESGMSLEALPRSLLLHAEQVCRRFEAAWRSGGRPRLEDYLLGESKAVARFLLRELLLVELEWRGQAGEGFRPEEYLQRFPGLDPAWLESPFGPATTALDGAPGQTIPALAGLRPGRCIGDYELLEELGRGGMGVVYQARHLRLNRVVALKMILAGSHAGEQDLLRFLAEAEAVAALQHPHVVQLFDFGQHQGLPYFTLEFVAGGSLADRLQGTPLAPREAARVVEQLARGMAYAHERGILHRDLKPHNVLLAEDGTPKITDFGLAKKLDVGSGFTPTGAVMGTPSYMAPEQAVGKSKEVGPAADVYALGAILYECLTGRPPFRAALALDTLMQVVSDEPVAVRQLQPRLPADLETIAHKCLQKEPGKRYDTAQELAEDLRRFQNGEPIRARPVGQVERAWRWCRRNPVVATLTMLLLLAVALGLGAVAWQWQQVIARDHEIRRLVVELRNAKDESERQKVLRQLEAASGETTMHGD
jgi:eukaryotic-like serine/threonine-protein kinase